MPNNISGKMKVKSGKMMKFVMLVCISIAFHFPLSTFHSLQAQYKVVHLEAPYNTPGSETGALRPGDTVLVYSTMPPKVVTGNTFGYDDAVMQLYQARIGKEGRVARPKPCRWGFNSKRDHTGNLALDPANRDAYFTRGDVETLRCDIWYAQGMKRRGWEKPVKLSGPVNSKQYTATHPTVGRINDTTTILYFVSDRPGGMGGLDIWYSLVRNGASTEPVNLGPQVNSADDEVTPFYDQRNGVLYFSSDREGGQGGFDIYSTVGSRNTWQQAEAVCHCLNSPQNDLYFTVTEHDPASGIPTKGYLSSNRKDSYFLSDSMCCNDLYGWTIDTATLLAMLNPPKDTDTVVPEPSWTERYQAFAKTIFPLPLYFHNDDPDPASRDTATHADYSDCQLRYALLRSTYLAHQRTTQDAAAMQTFFDSCVVGNFDKLNQLFDYVEAALNEGKHVVLTVAGYASPVFSDDYNRALSQRRIGSFINMVRAWHGGRFADALSDGRLRVEQQPMGIDELSAFNPRLSDAVYSLQAALARRIEVHSCKIF